LGNSLKNCCSGRTSNKEKIWYLRTSTVSSKFTSICTLQKIYSLLKMHTIVFPNNKDRTLGQTFYPCNQQWWKPFCGNENRISLQSIIQKLVNFCSERNFFEQKNVSLHTFKNEAFIWDLREHSTYSVTLY
jgi:hypothetical protein